MFVITTNQILIDFVSIYLLIVKMNASDDDSVDTPSILIDNGSEDEYLPSDSDIMSSEEGKHSLTLVLFFFVSNTICYNNLIFLSYFLRLIQQT